MERDLPSIDEIIIVEGRDDTNAINRAVRAITIETHGFGISKETWEKIANAYETKGIIIFTDPDHAGKEIRRRVKESFPEAKEAFLVRSKAEKDGDIGIENASPEDIREALSKARATEGSAKEDMFSPADMDRLGLSGGKGSKERRELVGDALGIGYYNAKALLKRLNLLGIEPAKVEEVLKDK